VRQYNAGGSNKISRSIFVSEEEYIADVVLTSSGFTNLQYAVNPGNATTFPWLSTIAANFNKYRFTKLLFKYRPIVSGYATAGQTGDIILSFNPDASDPAPVAQAQVYDLQMRDNDEPCVPFVLNKLSIAEINKQDSYYVRVGAAPASTDIKTYDVGNLNVSTTGTASSGTCGKLFVEYTCMLHSPVLIQPATGGVLHFSSLTATSANNFAGAVLQTGGTPALAGISLATGNNTVTFPAGVPGNYLLNVTLSAATSVGAISYSSVTSGVTSLGLLTNSSGRDSISYLSSNAGTTSNVVSLLQILSVTSAGGTFVMSPGTIVTSGTAFLDVWIVALPVTVLTADAPSNRDVTTRLDRLEALLRSSHLRVDSDFEDEVGPSSTPPRQVELSQSTTDLIGELIARKSNSRK